MNLIYPKNSGNWLTNLIYPKNLESWLFWSFLHLEIIFEIEHVISRKSHFKSSRTSYKHLGKKIFKNTFSQANCIQLFKFKHKNIYILIYSLPCETKEPANLFSTMNITSHLPICTLLNMVTNTYSLLNKQNLYSNKVSYKNSFNYFVWT